MKSFTSGSTMRYRPAECSPVEQRTRRQLLRRIGFGSLGLGLSTLLRKDGRGATPGRPARAKSCIMIFLFGRFFRGTMKILLDIIEVGGGPVSRLSHTAIALPTEFERRCVVIVVGVVGVDIGQIAEVSTPVFISSAG